MSSSNSNSRTTQQLPLVAAAEQQQSSGSSSSSSTSHTLEAAHGTAVEAGEHGGARRGKLKWRSRRSYFVVGESRPH